MAVGLHSDWLIPDWPAPVGVRAVFTSRAGGVSSPPHDSLNLGNHVGDCPESVAANRALLQRALDVRAVFLNQVHGNKVLLLEPLTPDGQCADACVTQQRQLACTVMVADCLPVLLSTLDGRAVAAAHAGWRGLAGEKSNSGPSGQGVLEAVYAALRALTSVDMPIVAWLGPCIGPHAFEVGPEVKAAFQSTQPEAAAFFTATGQGKYLANLPMLARLRLKALGVHQIDGNDGSPSWCTVSHPTKFFSHRRDASPAGNGNGNGLATTGRMAACIWRE